MKVQQSYYLPSMTAIATLVLEEDGEPARDETAAADAYEQLHGLDAVPGNYPFSLERPASA